MQADDLLPGHEACQRRTPVPLYQAQRAYEAGGLPGLLPDRPGPRRPHKLSDEVVEALLAAKSEQPELTTADLVEIVRARFGISVLRRSIDRALSRKKTPMMCRPPSAALAAAEHSACWTTTPMARSQ